MNMRNFGEFEKEVIKWITNQKYSDVNCFEKY